VDPLSTTSAQEQHKTTTTTTMTASSSLSYPRTALPSPLAMKVRQCLYYLFLATLIADAYASKGDSLMHLTMWSFMLHILYMGLPLTVPSTLDGGWTQTMVLLLHGPSWSGAHALFAMYCWTLYANPQMEFDLAPPGRAHWLILLRAAWLHVGPVLVHHVDFASHVDLLRHIYQSSNIFPSWFLLFWASVGGYFAMGLTWEQVNGDAAGTYNVQGMDEETYVNVSKALGVLACLYSFTFGTKAYLMAADK